ncbi:MAG TPA: FAD:protein FMN transferase [Ktedonobacterales bacterium]|nr:FAD:protein FMN transferase [Ktedonobacterales bacterium]
MLVQRYERIMGTPVGAQVPAPPAHEDAARAAIDACLEWMREVDRRLTRFKPESDLMRLNAAAGAWAPISDMLFEVVERSLLAAEATDGLFDPTILPMLEAWGYDRDFSAIAYEEAALEWRVPNDLIPPGHWREIELDRRQQRIRLPAGVRLDLGGIAKGWAADIALDRFFGAFPNALVDVGGDLRARGEVEAGKPWPVGVGAGRAIRDNQPDAPPEQQAVVTLGKGGLATSGAGARWWLRAGERAHHLIDPRTGRPARIWLDAADDRPDEPPLIASASAFAPTAAEAEVAAKVALLLGYPAALEAVEAVEESTDGAVSDADRPGIALLLTLGTGAVVFSSNLPTYLARMGGGDIWIS